MTKEVRVRFAPSPTGPLHIGGVRTALFNYLFAKMNNGKMLLRIEDTDQTRYVEGAEAYIKESLEWCGIIADESPWKDGAFGPYRQSERKDIYAKYAQQLINEGKAYYAFDTSEELEEMRKRLEEAKASNRQYNAITRMQMKNSLTLPETEVKEWLEAGKPYVIRLKVPKKEDIRFNDMVRGWVKVHSTTLDDKILLKADGMPTYHLANVVDDHLMEISHVIRGEEWLPSAPFHALLYKALGWESTMPQFAHLPLLLKPSGKGKLSKRDGDKLGFSVFPLEWTSPDDNSVATGYREDGYLPESFINFLALLGWSPGTEQEIFSMEELIESFSIENISKSGAKFDIEKAKWYNQQYLKNLSDKELAGFLFKELEREGISCPEDKAERICGLMKERITFPAQLWSSATYFFKSPEAFDAKVIKKRWNEQVSAVFVDYIAALKPLDDYNADTAKEVLNATLEKHELNIGRIMQILRVSITGLGGGPDLMPIMEVIGKDEVIERIKNFVDSHS